MKPKLSPPSTSEEPRALPSDGDRRVADHFLTGWTLVAVFATLGLVLEALHGFKVPWYVDAAATTRRLMWTLAHAHGLLLGLLNIAYGSTLATLHTLRIPRAPAVSLALRSAGVALPLGFFAAGVVPYAGDPGLPILLVPVAALLLLWAVISLVLALRRATRGPTR